MNELDKLESESAKWHLMVDAAKQGAERAGFKLYRLPGRGLSNVWSLEKAGQGRVTSIRTTRDRWIAFPPLVNGTKWKTLDDVELVLVAAVDDKERPKNVQIYLFEAAEVRQRFDAAYSARVEAGNVLRDNYGMWIALDTKPPGPANSVGSGLADKYKPIATFSLEALVKSGIANEVAALEPDLETPAGQIETRDDAEPPLTIAEAKRRLAISLGVSPSSIKITVEA